MTTSQPSQLKPFSLTFVVFDPEDDFGEIWALLSLAPPFYICALLSVLVVGRDLRAFFLLIGLISTSAFSTILKKIWNQPRPADHLHATSVPLSETEGMPSNHAAFVTFAAIFALLYAYRQCKNTEGNSRIVKRIKQWLLAGVLTLVATGCSYSRVHLGYHTPNQVYVGNVVGGCLGVLFYILYEARYICNWAYRLETIPILEAFDFWSPHHLNDVGAVQRQDGMIRRTNKKMTHKMK